jgi:hypothetical protein
MAAFKLITPEAFGERRWRRFTDVGFAARDILSTLVLPELPRAMLHMPVALTPHGEGYVPAALQGLDKDENLFVGASGRWLGGYMPAAYRAYPFAFTDAGDGRRLLCFDEDSGLLTDGEGEAFFDESGEASEVVRGVVDFLSKLSAARTRSRQCCDLLARHELIVPWPARVTVAGRERVLNGLYRIDEAALQTLPADALAELRDGGALPLIYCQLLSMQNLGRLVQLAEHRAAAAPAFDPETDSIDELLGRNDEVLSFDF